MLENTSVRQGSGVQIMAKENLFEDMGAEEMRQRLQVVSELMDEVINERRRQLRQQNMKRDDLLEDPMWNLAHDVLEIVHCLGRESSLAEVIEKCIDTKLKPIEEKLTKVEKLVVGYADGSAEEEAPLGAKFDKLIISDPQTGECTVWGALSTEDAPVPPSEDIAFDGSDLDGLSRRDTILRLVIVYGWNYGDAVDFAMNYQDSRGVIAMSGGVVILSKKGDFRLGVTLGSNPSEGERIALDIYLLKINVWISLDRK